MEIRLKKSDIMRGRCGSATKCALARAIKRELPPSMKVSVADTVEISVPDNPWAPRTTFITHDRMKRFMSMFDGISFKPWKERRMARRMLARRFAGKRFILSRA